MTDIGSEVITKEPSEALTGSEPKIAVPTQPTVTSGINILTPRAQEEIRVDTEEKLKEKRKQIGLYRGEMDKYLNRGIKGYEAEWNQEGRESLSYDELIVSALQNAEAQGRNEVTVFDFGCGEARAYADLLTDDSLETRKFIKDHPDINLKLLGLTDINGLRTGPRTMEAADKGRDMKLPDEPNVSCHVDFRAITAASTLEDYFKEKGIEEIDVAMAVQALSYLPPKNFDATIRSLVDHLRPGGVFIAAPYASRVNGFYRTYFGGPGLDVGSRTEGPSLKNTLREKGFRFSDPNADVNKEMEILEDAFNKYKDLGVLTDEDIDNRINATLPKGTKLMNKLRGKSPNLSQVQKLDNAPRMLEYVGNLLYDAETKLGYKHLEKEKGKKKEVLEGLQADLGSSADVSFGDTVIEIKKN